MLYEFLIEEREPILAQCELALLNFGQHSGTQHPIYKGWHMFYDEIIDLLKRDKPFEFHTELGMHTKDAKKHGKAYIRLGYTVSEVVHSYGVICQTITQFADEMQYSISSREFRQLNLSLDTAIAEAVTEFEKVKEEQRDAEENKRLGFLAHELRNSLQSAMIALEMIEGGSFGARSNTGGVLPNSLQRMASLIDTALTEVRMRIEPAVTFERIRVYEIISEVGMTAGFQARLENLTLQMQGFSDLEVNVDRQLIVSALANIVQNALKFTKPGGVIQVRTRRSVGRVLIEVEDQCGGLDPHAIEDLFKPYVQKGENKSGVGLGLTISRRAVELNHGSVRVENLPGEGCIFIIDLAEAPPIEA